MGCWTVRLLQSFLVESEIQSYNTSSRESKMEFFLINWITNKAFHRVRPSGWLQEWTAWKRRDFYNLYWYFDYRYLKLKPTYFYSCLPFSLLMNARSNLAHFPENINNVLIKSGIFVFAEAQILWTRVKKWSI